MNCSLIRNCFGSILLRIQLLLFSFFKPASFFSEECTDLVVHEKFRWQLKQKASPRKKKIIYPMDVTEVLFTYLDAQQLSTASMVSKQWFFLSFRERYWYRLCIRDFLLDPLTVEGYHKKETCSRTLYKLLQTGKRRCARIGFEDTGFRSQSIRV